jgi:HK97 family phage major capsid protein
MDSDQLLRAVYGAYFDVQPSVRPRHRWVMDAAAWRVVIGLRSNDGLPLCFPVPGRLSVWTLLGLPVEIDDDAEGIRLVDAV